MPKSVDFYFDFGSPTAYLAWTQLPALCAQTGASLVFKPMLLGGVFQATGNHSPVEIAAKGPYMFADLQRYARRYAVPYQHNPHFPVNTLLLMRGAVGLQQRDEAQFQAYVAAMFQAMWVDAKNMNDPAVVGGVLAQAGLNPASLLALTAEPAVKEQLKAATQAAVERGIFGAPTMFVGQQMFWGQDRLDFVREALLAND